MRIKLFKYDSKISYFKLKFESNKISLIQTLKCLIQTKKYDLSVAQVTLAEFIKSIKSSFILENFYRQK